MDKYGPQRYGPSADTPPPYTVVGRHDMMPNVNHDEVARFNFLTNMVKHLSTRVLPGNAVAYEKRARPRYETQTGHSPTDRR